LNVLRLALITTCQPSAVPPEDVMLVPLPGLEAVADTVPVVGSEVIRVFSESSAPPPNATFPDGQAT
jgi:hypothetical protein